MAINIGQMILCPDCVKKYRKEYNITSLKPPYSGKPNLVACSVCGKEGYFDAYEIIAKTKE